MQGVWVRSLVRGLRSNMLHGVAKTQNTKKHGSEYTTGTDEHQGKKNQTEEGDSKE